MKHREILNSLCPDFARENQTESEFIEKKKREIVKFIADYASNCGARGIVLGISGGIDSFLAGALCAEAMKDINKKLHLVLLPNGEQSDYNDAADCAETIRRIYPDTIIDTVSINGAYNAAVKDLSGSGEFAEDAYTLGNLQPRLRMMYQYALAKNMLVAGTDHATESVVGFYTKYGDGGSDINPIQELIKDDIYKMSELFDAPEAVMKKAPAAGLGISKDDESELKITYKDLCAFLKGHKVPEEAYDRIISAYDKSAHKRAVPASPKDLLYKKEERAIVVVDLIHAFVDGSLPCIGASQAVLNTVDLINDTPQAYTLYVCDSHPADHCSFTQNGGKWCDHAVAGTKDAELPDIFYNNIKKSINTPRSYYNIFLKGTNPWAEQYSGYNAYNRNYGLLKDNLPKNVIVAGAATEYCVFNTVRDLVEHGHEVTVYLSCLAFTDRTSHLNALEQMGEWGVTLVVHNNRTFRPGE